MIKIKNTPNTHLGFVNKLKVLRRIMFILPLTFSGMTHASADVNNEKLIAKGKQLFILCGACHSKVVAETMKIGPHLAGIFNRPVASVEGYNYSPAASNVDFFWDEEHLDKWLQNPAKMMPGTKMALPGLGESKRRAIIAYLKTL